MILLLTCKSDVKLQQENNINVILILTKKATIETKTVEFLSFIYTEKLKKTILYQSVKKLSYKIAYYQNSFDYFIDINNFQIKSIYFLFTIN